MLGYFWPKSRLLSIVFETQFSKFSHREWYENREKFKYRALCFCTFQPSLLFFSVVSKEHPLLLHLRDTSSVTSDSLPLLGSDSLLPPPPFSLVVPASVRTCIPPFLPFPFLFRRRRRSRWDGISFPAGTCVQSPTSPHSRCKTAVATRENVVRCQLKTR